MGDLLTEIDENSNIIVRGRLYRETEVLWELLTSKKANSSLITTNDLKT